MKLIRVTFVVSALAVLGGCAAGPVNQGDYAGSPGYYDAPAPAHNAPPVYHDPSAPFSRGA